MKYIGKITGINGILSIGGLSAGTITSWSMESDEIRQIHEQKILRAASGRSDEYVWSDILKCHVRIGEDLKA